VKERENFMGKLVKARILKEALEGIAGSTIYRMAKEGKIPCYRVGRRGIRFDVEEVRAALRRSVSSGLAENAEARISALSSASADMNGNNSSRNKR
jgi:excisionase family DNA binding protein